MDIVSLEKKALLGITSQEQTVIPGIRERAMHGGKI